MENHVKALIEGGGQALGVFCELGGTAAAECAGLAGLDFLILDTEHGPFDAETAIPAIIAARLRGTEPFVRAKDSSRASVLRLLDVGAAGVIVPNVQSAEEAEKLVEYAKYAPLGNRGFAWTRAAGYGFDADADLAAHFARCNRQTMLLPQCETLGCLNEIEAVAALPGVDGVFIGPYDLSIALGVPGQMDSPALADAIAVVRAACKKAGKPVFIYAGDVGRARMYFSLGVEAVACGMDVLYLTHALCDMAAAVRGK